MTANELEPNRGAPTTGLWGMTPTTERRMAVAADTIMQQGTVETPVPTCTPRKDAAQESPAAPLAQRRNSEVGLHVHGMIMVRSAAPNFCERCVKEPAADATTKVKKWRRSELESIRPRQRGRLRRQASQRTRCLDDKSHLIKCMFVNTKGHYPKWVVR